MSSKVSPERWGVGKNTDEKAFETGKLDDGTPYELIFGEFPHSRSDKNIYARFSGPMGADNERIVGFDGHRIHVRLELRTMNYLKTSGLSGDEVRKGGEWRVWLNEHEVYSGFTRDPFEALLQIRQKLDLLMDLPVDLWKGETPVGRKVYYRQTPAIITNWFPDQGCVILEVDGEDYFPSAPWDTLDEMEREKTIKDDILTPHIWWWRKDE